MNFKRKKLKSVAGAGVLGLAAIGLLAGCVSDADRSSENVSKKAEQFEVQREIIGINTRSGEYLFHYVGRCSVESGSGESSMKGYMEIMCKHGPDDYRKHYELEATDVHIHTTQLEPIDVSVYHTKIIIKPQNLIPEFSIEGGKQ